MKDRLRLQLLELRSSLAQSINDPNPNDETIAEKEELAKKIRSKENQQRRGLPDNFVGNIEDFANDWNSVRTNVASISFKEAPWQADPAIAKRAIDGEIEAILSGDSDFPMYVGIGGLDSFGDMMLRNPELTRKKDGIQTLEIWTGQRSVVHYIDGILNQKITETIFESSPKYAVFDGVRTLRIRTLLAIALGCDALPGGIFNFGAAKVYEQIKTTIDWKWDDKTVTEHVLNKLVDASKESKPKECRHVAKGLTKDVFRCLSDSLMYEPTTLIGCPPTIPSGYLSGTAPSKLDEYNTMFGNGDEEYVDGPKTIQCRGCLQSSTSHLFLQAEGSFKCHVCHNTICRSCVWDPSAPVTKSEAQICLSCKYDSFVGIDEVTEDQMRQFLAQNKVSFNQSKASYEEVLQLYHIHKDSDDDNLFSEAINEVQYPLLPASALHYTQLMCEGSKIRPTIDQYEKKGPIIGILRDLSVGPKAVMDLICLLASLTRYQKREKGKPLSFEHAVPTNVVQMAAESRVHSGERIVKRSLRHSLDPRTPDVSNANFMLSYFNDEPCLVVLDHNVKASMRQDLYPVECAFTENDLVATTCGCKAGCCNKSKDDLGEHRICCTHCYVPPVQLGLQLHNGLAEEILCELRLRFVIDEDSFLDLDLEPTDWSKFRSALEQLILVARGKVPTIDANESFVQWLADFRVGTDSAKSITKEPKLQSLGLFREKVKYETSLAAANKIINGSKAQSTVDGGMEESIVDSAVEQNAMEKVPNYLGVKMCMEAMAGIGDLSNLEPKEPIKFTPIGFELLDFRACKAPLHERSGAEYTQKVEQLRVSLRAALKDADGPNSRGYYMKSKVTAAATMSASSTVNDENLSPNRPKRKTVAAVTPSPQKKKRRTIASPPVPRPPPPSATCRPCCAYKCPTNDWLPFSVKRISAKPSLVGKTEEQIEKLERPGGALDRWYIRRFQRNEELERLVGKRDCPLTVRYNYCSCHKHELVRGKTTTRKLSDGSTRRLKIPDFYAPVPTGRQGFATPTKTANKGNGNDRHLHRLVTEIRDSNEFGTALQATLEMEDVKRGEQQLDDINERVLKVMGLDVHRGAVMEQFPLPPKAPVVDQKKEEATKPAILLKDLNPVEVKRRTGYRDITSLLSYAMVVCDGDLNKLFSTTSKMTWLEEWVFYFEFKWGRTASRWAEYEKSYACTQNPLRRVLLRKLHLELTCRDRWPIYATYEEDAKFRGKQWDLHFDRKNGPRIVMHDATDLPMPTPENAELQRALFSDYYGGPCAKGGVSNQLCGWIRGLPLCTGRITDSQLIKETGILKQQRLFSEADDTHSDVPFTNTVDKGFRIALEAAQEKQTCMQPDFSKGNFQFTGKETLHTACIAMVRSGNERAVKRCKMSWFIKRGCAYQLWNENLVCDMWEAWTFQVNFMYDKFL